MGFLRCGKRVSYKTGLCRYDSFGPKRVGFGRLSTRFAQVAAAFAGSLACGRCACERGAWEEGRGGDGVGAMGSCQGVFGVWDWRWRRPLAAHLPWVPAKGGTDDACQGTRWRAGAVGGGGPFDRLRANGISKRACDVGWWGRATARRTSGYRLSPVRRWRVWEVREAEAPRAGPLPWVPAFARTTVGGGGAACRYCVGLPHPAPLDSCLRRNDAGSSAGTTVGGVLDARELLVAEGPSTGSGRTERVRSAPAKWVGGGVPPPGLPRGLRAPRSPFDFPQGERHRHGPSGFLPSQE